VGRGGKSRKRLVLATLGVVGALIFGGCDWSMFGYDAALTHSSADNNISTANVATVKQLFIGPGAFASPAVVNGVAYAGGQSGKLYAFDANGGTNCSGTPNQCSPMWTGTTAGGFVTSTPAVATGVVYAVSNSGTLYAFDANGSANCSGTPKVCTPLWTASTSGGESSPNVVNGVVYIGGAFVEAFDAHGSTNCSGTPKVCHPLWTSTSNATFTSPAVTNGVLYTTAGTTGNDKVFAFSANGTTNCSGTPTTCNPLWTGTLGTLGSMSSPAVSTGVVYAESSDGKLFAFDASGATNCSGTPKACSPLWTAALSGTPQFNSSPAVANGVVYAPSSTLQAFDANGSTNCSGTPKVCTPLWSYNVTVYAASPSVANGLVYIGSASNASPQVFGVEAFDASGHTNCSGTPTVCNPLWTGDSTGVMTGSPAIANGKVYDADSSFNLGFDTHLYGWALPPPMTHVAIPSNNATISGTQLLDAFASAGVTQLQFEVTGGTLNHSVIGTATPTYYGWLVNWNTTTVPNGVYTLQSVASYGGEVSGTSPGITFTVANPSLADLANSSFTATQSVGGSGCGIVHLTFDAVYPGSAAVGNVTLHIAGCVSDPYTYAGSFTITTGVGTLSGSATGTVTEQDVGGRLTESYQITLSVTAATGSFSGTTGSLLFSASSQNQVASLAVE
jgi:outer membrane protein assembly factor BamB